MGVCGEENKGICLAGRYRAATRIWCITSSTLGARAVTLWDTSARKCASASSSVRSSLKRSCTWVIHSRASDKTERKHLKHFKKRKHKQYSVLVWFGFVRWLVVSLSVAKQSLIWNIREGMECLITSARRREREEGTDVQFPTEAGLETVFSPMWLGPSYQRYRLSLQKAIPPQTTKNLVARLYSQQVNFVKKIISIVFCNKFNCLLLAPYVCTSGNFCFLL